MLTLTVLLQKLTEWADVTTVNIVANVIILCALAYLIIQFRDFKSALWGVEGRSKGVITDHEERIAAVEKRMYP